MEQSSARRTDRTVTIEGPRRVCISPHPVAALPRILTVCSPVKPTPDGTAGIPLRFVWLPLLPHVGVGPGEASYPNTLNIGAQSEPSLRAERLPPTALENRLGSDCAPI